MALKDLDLFVVRDSSDNTNKKVQAQDLQTYVTGGANVQAVQGGAGITATDVSGTVTVDADLNHNRGLEFTGTGNDRQIAIAIGDGLEFDASGKLKVSNEALNFRGNVDLTDFATLPAGQVDVGDTFINVGNGTVDLNWAPNVDGLAVGEDVFGGDMIVCETAGVGAAAQYTYIHAGGGGGGIQAVNLIEGNVTTTTVDVVCDAGDDATLLAATSARAGLMTAADKEKLDTIIVDGDGNVTDIEVNLSRARDAATNTVECDMGDDAVLTGAEPSSSGAGGFAGLLVASDKEKLDGIGEGAAVVSVTAQNGVKNTNVTATAATQPVLEANFGPTPGGTPTTVMPYDISLLDSI